MTPGFVFIIAYLTIRKQKEAIGFDRNMKDSEITRRLLHYAKPYWKNFAAVLCLPKHRCAEILPGILDAEARKMDTQSDQLIQKR